MTADTSLTHKALASQPDRWHGHLLSAPLSRRCEWTAIVVLMALYGSLRVWALSAQPINDKFDEGVYLSLMQCVASGKGQLYRDLMLCHPPGVIWAGSRIWYLAQGSMLLVRLALIAFSSLACIPLYLLCRRLYGARIALTTLALVATAPGFANWLGRLIFLDLPLNVLLYISLWMLVCLPPRRGLVPLLAGAILGAGFLLKETAVPAACAVCAALGLLARARPRRAAGGWEGFGLSWLYFGGGFLLVFLTILGLLAHIPGYVYYTYSLNAHAHFQWALRPHELLSGFYALSLPMTFGLAGLVRMAQRGADPRARFLALWALLQAGLMLLVPRAFYWRYLISVMPIFCLGAAVWADGLPGLRGARRLISLIGVVLFGAVHLAGLVLYHTFEAPTTAAQRQALEVLRTTPVPLFTLDPIWAPATGHPLEAEVQRLNRVVIDVPVQPGEYAAVLRSCGTVLLNRETLHWLPPETMRDIRRDYRTVFRSGAPGERGYLEILVRR